MSQVENCEYEVIASVLNKVHNLSNKTPYSDSQRTLKSSKYGNQLTYFFELHQPNIEETFQLRYHTNGSALEEQLDVTIVGLGTPINMKLVNYRKTWKTDGSIENWNLVSTKLDLLDPSSKE